MKRITLALTVLAFLSVFSTSAEASDKYFGWYVAARNHGSDHAVLNHRARHRAAEHHNAHHYPMTRYQHTRTHARLNHQAAHDQVRHHARHDRHAYSPYIGFGHGGFNIYSPYVSVLLGH